MNFDPISHQVLRAREHMVLVAFRFRSAKASVSLLLLVLVAGGGGWMLLGQGGSEKRQKVVKASPATTSVTSALPHGFARVSPTTDEWKAVPLKDGEDKKPRNMYDGTPSGLGWSLYTDKSRLLLFP